METAILISELNDFIFCPRSIYYHHIYGAYDTSLYHTTDQSLGNIAHRTIDQQKYSTRKTILQGMSISSERFGIIGKIDLYDTRTGILTERKRQIKKIYDGYCLQLYAQYFCLSEMGYIVTGLRFHSLIDNRTYPIPLPGPQDESRFSDVIERFRKYSLDSGFNPRKSKCQRCIYRTLCDRSLV